jgi:hypothetical protein
VTLELETSRAAMRREERAWVKKLSVDLPSGARSSSSLEIKPSTWIPSIGTLHAQVKINREHVILDETLPFNVSSPWFVQVGFSLLGGLLYAGYVIFREDRLAGGAGMRRKRKRTALALSVIAGVLGYLAVRTKVLGIEVDTTSVQAFALVGFFFGLVSRKCDYSSGRSPQPCQMAVM